MGVKRKWFSEKQNDEKKLKIKWRRTKNEMKSLSLEGKEIKIKTYRLDLSFNSVRFRVSFDVRKSVQANTKAIKALLWAGNRNDLRSSVGFCNTTISLKTDNFWPDFIVNLAPFVNNLRYLVLIKHLEERKKTFKTLEEGGKGSERGKRKTYPKKCIKIWPDILIVKVGATTAS